MLSKELESVHRRAEKTVDAITDLWNIINAGLCNEDLDPTCREYVEVVPLHNRFLMLRHADGSEFLLTITECDVQGKSLVRPLTDSEEV